MPPIFSNKRLIVLLASIIILVALIGYSMKEREQELWPEQFFKDTIGWFQEIFYRPAQYVAGFFENIENLRMVYQQNQILKARLDEYAELAEEVKALRERNEELQAILKKTKEADLSDYTIYHAAVIARSPDRWNEQITVNKGKQDGIRRHMAVITADGLIGKVDTVAPFSATIQLISDPNRKNLISAVIRKNQKEIYGMIEGFDPETKSLLLTGILPEAPVKKGDRVVTSGLGGVYPAGLIIGKVKRVKPDQYGLTKTAFVEPAANLNHFYHVMVVDRLAPSPKLDPADGGEDS